MPHYEFFCHACKKVFSKVLSLAEYEKGEAICPAVAVRKWNRPGPRSTPSRPRRAPKNHARSTAPKVVIDRDPPGRLASRRLHWPQLDSVAQLLPSGPATALTHEDIRAVEINQYRPEGSLGWRSSTSMPSVPMVASTSSRSSGERTSLGIVIHLVICEIRPFLSGINEFLNVVKSHAESLSASSRMEQKVL